ncbi:MAG: hypothetical protein ABIH34_01105 [Nanoarchaeota archaeon]
MPFRDDCLDIGEAVILNYDYAESLQQGMKVSVRPAFPLSKAEDGIARTTLKDLEVERQALPFEPGEELTIDTVVQSGSGNNTRPARLKIKGYEGEYPVFYFQVSREVYDTMMKKRSSAETQ